MFFSERALARGYVQEFELNSPILCSMAITVTPRVPPTKLLVMFFCFVLFFLLLFFNLI